MCTDGLYSFLHNARRLVLQTANTLCISSRQSKSVHKCSFINTKDEPESRCKARAKTAVHWLIVSSNT